MCCISIAILWSGKRASVSFSALAALQTCIPSTSEILFRPLANPAMIEADKGDSVILRE